MKSWKTTTAGIGVIISTLGTALNQLFDGNPATNPDWNMVLPLLFTGIIGLFARDNNVPSEAVKSAAAAAQQIKSDTTLITKP